MIEDLIQRMMTSVKDIIESCHEMDGCSVQVMMMPEAYAKKADSSGILLAQERSYAKSDSIISNRKICIRFVPIVDRLFEDISKAKDRTVEAVFYGTNATNEKKFTLFLFTISGAYGKY
ncbi:hypothetical protein DWY49_15305 [Roseburia sp. AF25-25LB]|nr:hypothetical protein DWY49_15305 [Roseburia sp. AF25-25LB]